MSRGEPEHSGPEHSGPEHGGPEHGGPGRRGPSPPDPGGPGPGPLLLSAAAFGAAAWLAGRRPGGLWTGEVLILAGAAFGALAHAGARRHRPGPGLMAWLEGRSGYYLLFVGAALFLAAESYAAGLALDAGAPVVALAMLLPPVVVAGFALRRAERAGTERAGTERAEGGRSRRRPGEGGSGD